MEVMGDAYPELVRNADFVSSVAGREEERFRANLRSGMALLEAELGRPEQSSAGRRPSDCTTRTVSRSN